MARPLKNSYVTECTWFKKNNYDQLCTDAGYKLWPSVIRDRVMLQAAARSPLTDRAWLSTLTMQLLENPLQPLNFTSKTNISGPEAARAYVAEMTLSRLAMLTQLVSKNAVDPFMSVGDNLDENGNDLLNDFVHLTIDTRASDAVLLAEFKKLLQSKRRQSRKVLIGNHQMRAKKWGQQGLVEFFDLRLFTLVTGRNISEEHKKAMIFPGRTENEQTALFKKIKPQSAAVFHLDVAHAIESTIAETSK